MKKLLYLSVAIMVVACGSRQQSNYDNNADLSLIAEFYNTYIQSKYGVDTVSIQDFIRKEAESLDSCYLIHYKQAINGYDIRMKVDSVSYIFSEIICNGNILISKGDNVILIPQLTVCFPDSLFSALNKHKINKLDFSINKESYYENLKYPHLGEYSNSPFFFFDVDFDNEKELIMRVSGMGQRARNCYYPIALNWGDTCNWEWADNAISKINSRYYPFDDMTQFDYAHKTFILHQSAGWWENEWHYYKYENRECNIVKKIVEYIECGKQKVKRITYQNNDSTTTNIPIDKNGSYSID